VLRTCCDAILEENKVLISLSKVSFLLHLKFARNRGTIHVGVRMAFLRRSAENIAAILPLIGIAACISYVITKQLFGGIQPPVETPAISTKAAPHVPIIRVTAVTEDTAQTLRPGQLAGQALRRALTLRDAMAGPVQEASSTVPIPKPRPKNFEDASRTTLIGKSGRPDNLTK
jgi:hypothetical protein